MTGVLEPVNHIVDPSLVTFNLLREHGARTTAYPFDWNICPLGSVIQLLQNKFCQFLDSSNLEYLPEAPRKLFREEGIHLDKVRCMITPVYCNRYHRLFPHDFPEAGREHLAPVQRKYSKRIEVFNNLASLNKNLVFVVHMSPLVAWQQQQYDLVGVRFPEPPPNWREQLLELLTDMFSSTSVQLSLLEELKFEEVTASVSS